MTRIASVHWTELPSVGAQAVLFWLNRTFSWLRIAPAAMGTLLISTDSVPAGVKILPPLRR
jgi:hypothetical protein